MSLALFHEFSGTQQSVGASLSGNFTAKDATEFVLLQGHRLLILKESPEESSSLRVVAECNLLSQAYSIAVVRGDVDSLDSVAVVFRHATISVLQFDGGVNQMKTVLQHCCAGELDLKPSSSFVCRFARVQGNVLATQFTPTSLTLIQLGPEVSSFTVPVKLSSALGLASLDDACFLPTKAGLLSLAVLGKTQPHAWIGRTSTISSRASAVRMVSVDFENRSVGINWSFESLPSSANDLVPLPAPRGGLLAVSPDTVSFCEEFGSSVVFPINKAADQNISSSENSSVHFLRPSDIVEIDLTGSHQTALSDELVIFSCRNQQVLACHLVRQNGTFSSVSALVWEPVAVTDSGTVPSSICVSENGEKLLITSGVKNSVLYRISSTEILLPMSVFSSSAEEAQLAELETAASEQEEEELIRMYQDEVHKGKIARSIELGLVDELLGFGAIAALEPLEDGKLLVSTKSGNILEMSGEIPTDLIFEISLKKMKSLFSFAYRNSHFLALSSGTQFILIDCSSGLKEIARRTIAQIEDIVPLLTEDGHLYLVTAEGLVTVHISAELEANILEEFTCLISPQTCCDPATACVAYLDAAGIHVLRLGVLNPEIANQFEISHTEVSCFSVSLSPNSEIFTTVCDSNGSLFIYRDSELVFSTAHASLCKPVLTNDSDATMASLSVTDASRRPLEANGSTLLFSQKIKIIFAKLVWISHQSPLLVLLVEGRPVLVYRQFGADRFSLVPFDNPLLISPAGTCLVKEISVSGHKGVWISASSSSLFLSQSDRGQLFLHPIDMGSFTALSAFSSDFAPLGAAIALEDSAGSSSMVKIFKIKSDTDLLHQFPLTVRSLCEEETEGYGMFTCRSVAGVAVDFVSEETDHQSLVFSLPAAPQMDEMDEMQPEVQLMPQNVSEEIPLTCPLPPRRQKHVIKIYSDHQSLVSSIIACQPNEIVTGLTWAESILGLGSDVLIIGTTLCLGEETPAQGRLVVVRVDYAPGLVAPPVAPLSEDSKSAGCKILYDSVKRSAITAVKDWKGCLAVGLGHRLMMYQWDGVAGRLRGVGMIDLGLQISSLSFFKSFILASDILRGVYLLRYKEDPVMDMQGRVVSMAASVQQIAKSAPLQSLTITLVDTIRLEGSVGIVSIDVFGNLNLEMFSPVHFGQYLRQSLPFQLPFKSLAVSRAGKSLIIGTASGSVCQLVPVSESEHHMAQTLNGLMIALLPQLGGVNPRLFHVGVGRESPPNLPQTVESVDLLASFLYLSTPLQAEIASRMKQPIDVLMRSVAKWIRPAYL